MSVKRIIFISVGKQSPCLLSFVYTSYNRYGIRAAPKFGKHPSLFSYHNKNTVYTNDSLHGVCFPIVFMLLANIDFFLRVDFFS